jgi:paraquat-inducible protein B
MTETSEQSFDEIPQAVVHHSRRLGLVWLIPLVAALVGAWLAVQAIVQAGPTITITFKSAEGLTAWKTKIKYKDVEIGQVESIHLSEDLSHVIITAAMVNDIDHYLTENTRFWVVRARVAGGEVSGLSTLFSGVYIGMDPGQPGQPSDSYTGLETPPAVSMDTPGSYFMLRSEQLGSLDIGSPIYYRQIKVGQVVGYEMTTDGSAVLIQIFIQAPHNNRVRQNTRFWIASGLDVSVDAKGVKVNTESVLALLIGGIAFQTPTNLEPGDPASEGQSFILYNNKDEIDEPVYTRKSYFVAYFDAVHGLNKGAPIEFRGIKVGEVVDVRLDFDEKKFNFRIPVLMAIETERISVQENGKADQEALIVKLVQKGLRAQLRTGVLLTGLLYINLNMHPDAPTQKVAQHGPYTVIPTVPGATQEITAGIASFVNRLEKLPMEQIGTELRDSLRQINRFVSSDDLKSSMTALNRSLTQLQQFTTTLNTDTGPQINSAIDQLRQTLEQTEKTLSATEGMVSGNAPLGYDIQQTMRELAKASRAVSVLADYQQRHPEALVFGKGAPQP